MESSGVGAAAADACVDCREIDESAAGCVCIDPCYESTAAALTGAVVEAPAAETTSGVAATPKPTTKTEPLSKDDHDRTGAVALQRRR